MLNPRSDTVKTGDDLKGYLFVGLVVLIVYAASRLFQ